MEFKDMFVGEWGMNVYAILTSRMRIVLVSPPRPHRLAQLYTEPRASRSANGETLYYPWHHPSLFLLKKETNIRLIKKGTRRGKEAEAGGGEGRQTNLTFPGAPLRRRFSRKNGRYQDVNPSTYLFLIASLGKTATFYSSAGEKLTFPSGDHFGISNFPIFMSCILN